MRLVAWLCTLLVAASWTMPAVAANCDTLPPPRPFVLDSIHTFEIDTIGGTDCWGWSDDVGTDYALFGVNTGIAVFNTTTMQYVATVPGPTESCGTLRWRDIKSYRNYCYAVSECRGLNQGMMIIDMQYLPDSVHFVGSFVPEEGWEESHNFTIDTATGYAYIQKYSRNGGFHVVDLSNPVAPVVVGGVDEVETHDLFARNDTVWVAESATGSYSMWNAANKVRPKRFAHITVPNTGYAHNIWPTEDGRYAATTDEHRQKQIKIWDFQDPDNVRYVGQILGPDYMAHNAHIYDDYLIVSHYTGGVFVADLSDPECPREVARFDTWHKPVITPYAGCWGVCPNTRSGQIYGSNTDGRLFILQSNILIPRMSAEPPIAWAPASVQLRDRSSGQVTAWDWDFGDGTSGSTAHPIHTYSAAGLHDVSLTVTTPHAADSISQSAFVTVLAETLRVVDTILQADVPLVWDIVSRNNVPMTELTLPINLSNTPSVVTLDSVSIVGTRSEQFDVVNVLIDNRGNGKYACRFKDLAGSGFPPLAPGVGSIARVYCRTTATAIAGDSVALTLDPLGIGGFYTLGAKTLTTAYVPEFTPSVLRVISCDCPFHGDFNLDSIFDATELNSLINYIFFNGPRPPQDAGCLHIDRGDFNCDGYDDAQDLNYIVRTIFFNGPPPCQPCDCHGYPAGCDNAP